MADYLGLTSTKWDQIFNNWWDTVLVVLIAGAVFLGSAYILFLFARRTLDHWRSRHQSPRLSRAVEKFFRNLKRDNLAQSYEKIPSSKSKSFGIFLGSFTASPGVSQTLLLTQWDVVVLDPFQAGVLDAISSSCTSSRVLGRFDVGLIHDLDNDDMVKSLDIVIQTILRSLKRPQDLQTRFTGVLLANWEKHFTTPILNEVLKFIVDVGLEVNLEISPAITLSECQPKGVKLELVSGLAIRNGTILADGKQRNYFQAANIRVATRALAQATKGRSIIMMWETVNDDVKLEHAIIKRSFRLCSFSNAISWIGNQAALTIPEIAAAKTIKEEPLGALMWLKDDQIIKLHDKWRLNETIRQEAGNHDVYDSLEQLIPDLKAKVSLLPHRGESRNTNQDWSINSLGQRLNTQHTSSKNPLSFSRHGEDCTGMGCFQLGLDSSWEDFEHLVGTQRHLRNLKLLKKLSPGELQCIGDQLHALYETDILQANSRNERTAIKQLVDLIATVQGKDTDNLRVYIGLDTGFHTDNNSQFWGFYDKASDSDVIDLYISAKAQDLPGTLLHTFMSSLGLSRTQCFLTEVALAKHSGSLMDPWDLPRRIVQDIQQLSPSETLLLFQCLVNFTFEHEHISLSTSILRCCEHQLMERPSILQLKESTTAYLAGEISVEDLISHRIEWYHEQGCQYPDPLIATSLFREINDRLPILLLGRKKEVLLELETVFRTILQKEQLDAGADLFALSVFCAFRRLALDEIYLEVLDRNPLPNGHSDQAACFAEMFATGSQCESYFNTTPNRLGTIISKRYFAYYKTYQPPVRDDMTTELPTAYSSNLVDLDLNAKPVALPLYYQISFLGVFALPALVDILLLTTIGRGLYLSTYMSDTEKSMATAALMVSLLLCGAIGTWISSGGNYYLHSMAFAAMNMYVLTRFIAGLAICFTGGLLAFLIIGATKGFYSGLIFFAYLFFLTTYLSLLATLSIYQVPGFQFQSGRIMIMLCIPILVLSPIMTLWIHNHDVLIYLLVLFCFLTALLIALRRVIAQWNTWYLNIPCLSDTEIANWHSTSPSISESVSDALEAPTSSDAWPPVPREVLLNHVLRERKRHFWTKPTTDELVLKLAKGYPATIFIMDWYCKYSRTKLPFTYSPTWNLQCKGAVETMKDMQKGIKLHNAFIHWRQTSDEVWCGVLYFVIALLDKWVALITGSSLVGLSTGSSETYRLAVGFGLAYYLIAAICLDNASQPLWILAHKGLPQSITSLKFVQQATTNDTRAKRKLYSRCLFKFLLIHIWGLAVTAALMLSFNQSKDGMILYISYIGAYSGLLWYQYNRIFAGILVLKNLLVAVVVGLLLGPVLHHFNPQSPYSGVISLASAAWTAAFLSLWTAKIGVSELRDWDEIGYKPMSARFCVNSAIDLTSRLSQTTLSEVYNYMNELPPDCLYRLDPLTHPGVDVMNFLICYSNTNASLLIKSAFQSREQMIRDIAASWRREEIVVDLVPAQYLTNDVRGTRVISRETTNRLHILVFIRPDRNGGEWNTDIHRNSRAIAECIIQTTAESRYDVSEDHSMLAGVLARDNGRERELSIPEGVQRQLRDSESDRIRVLKSGEKTLLRYTLLGFDCDTEWDKLPRMTRHFLLRRCCKTPGPIPEDQKSFLRSRFLNDDSLEIDEYVARCQLGAALSSLINAYAQDLQADFSHQLRPEPPELLLDASYFLSTTGSEQTTLDLLKRSLYRIHQILQVCIKFVVVSLVADLEYQRELDHLLCGQPAILRWPVALILNGIWIFCKLLQQMIIPIFLFHGRKNVSDLYSSTRCLNTVIHKHRVEIQRLDGPLTGFYTTLQDESICLRLYFGDHYEEPTGTAQLVAINTYTDELVMRRREEYNKGTVTDIFTYEYKQHDRPASSKQPLARYCIYGKLKGQSIRYDEQGHIVSGTFFKRDIAVTFSYRYRKNAKFIDELLRAEYRLPHLDMKVAWSVPPSKQPERLDTWIPYSKVVEASFTQGTDVYNSRWIYDHKFHPMILTTLNQQPVPTPPMIEHDWFDLLQKPTVRSFGQDNPLQSFDSVELSRWSRWLGRNVKRSTLSVSQARTRLWKSWKEGKTFDAVTIRWLDELALRSASVLKPYWRARGMGRLWAAEDYLVDQADNIVAQVDLDAEISSWTPLAFKFGDFKGFGQGGDARINTRTQSTQVRDTDTSLHVLAMDTGTWPNESGGVSACRRDMVNNLQSIKWHIIAESANDFGVPRFQTEKNIHSLTVLPLWGMDFLTPSHGIFGDCLDSTVQQKSHRTTEKNIVDKFLPILRILVRCSRAIELDHQLLDEVGRALINLNSYFATSRHWSEVWQSKIVKKAWIELWLTEDMENARPISEWLEAERPTLLHLENALDMWHRYLFIFSIPIPDKIPDVFQTSHHFAGASYGVLCKLKRSCSLQVWDHCISWREVTVFLSSAMSFDSPFVCTSLMCLSRVLSVLILHHADVVLPCADFFNPGWEIELGTCQGKIEHRSTYARKIDPVVNGICDMEKFKPIEEIKSKHPTVIMLSHIRFVKDIKTASLAADIIVNKWGFTDYRIEIYGDMEKAPTYAIECQEIIASKRLRDHVVLKGLGNPSEALADAWLFLNSSISEGLPLAMGEAALAGVPVVCTDVGASFRVVTDPATGKRFSAVVAPNDALSLARAQINVLALLGEWSEFADDVDGYRPTLSAVPTKDEVEMITKRMYEKSEQRRRLGMLGRTNIQTSFSEERYLREHEQMLWLGRYQSRSHQAKLDEKTSRAMSSSTTIKGW